MTGPTPAPPAPKAAPYCTVIRDRRPQTKTHTGIGQAKAAIGYGGIRHGVRGGQMFEWVDGAWVLLYVIDPGTRSRDLPWHVDAAARMDADQAERSRVVRLAAINAAATILRNTHVGIGNQDAWTGAEALVDAGWRRPA